MMEDKIKCKYCKREINNKDNIALVGTKDFVHDECLYDFLIERETIHWYSYEEMIETLNENRS